MSTIRLAMPFPPPVNNLFANGKRGRYKTPRYKDWCAVADRDIRAAKAEPVLGEFNATFVFQRPTRAKRDLDGLLKAPLDALVNAGLIEDDHLCVGLRASWADGLPVGKGALVLVEIAPA